MNASIQVVEGNSFTFFYQKFCMALNGFANAINRILIAIARIL